MNTENKISNVELDLFLKHLEEKLEQKKMSIPQFAQEMNVSKMIVYKWIRKESVMSLDKYFKAKKILGIK